MSIHWTHRTLIVPAAIADTCRSLCAGATPAGAGMFTTGLSPDGTGEPTHYISAGLLDQEFVDLLGSPDAMALGLEALGIDVSLEQATGILAQAVISEEEPHSLLAELGLSIIQE